MFSFLPSITSRKETYNSLWTLGFAFDNMHPTVTFHYFWFICLFFHSFFNPFIFVLFLCFASHSFTATSFHQFFLSNVEKAIFENFGISCIFPFYISVFLVFYFFCISIVTSLSLFLFFCPYFHLVISSRGMLFTERDSAVHRYRTCAIDFVVVLSLDPDP